jgi:hypothetical protein
VRAALAALALLAACSPGRDPAADNQVAPAPPAPSLEPLQPPPPGSPGGLPDDRSPVSEAPFTETSAQGAANVVQTYFALIEGGRYGDAWRLWADEGSASGTSESGFVRRFGAYSEYHAQVGAPGRIEGAAGSLYVEVPALVYGRRKDGARFDQSGTVTLKRVNDVPGSTEGQRRWHVSAVNLRPKP